MGLHVFLCDNNRTTYVISFLLLQITIYKCECLRNTDVLSYSSRGQKSEMSLTE